jgi:hypothetical protein
MRPTMALDHTPETRLSLHALEQRGDSIRRHIGPDPRQIGDMLGTLGLATLEALIDRAVPAAIRITEPLALPEAKTPPAPTPRTAEGPGISRILDRRIVSLTTHRPIGTLPLVEKEPLKFLYPALRRPVPGSPIISLACNLNVTSCAC